MRVLDDEALRVKLRSKRLTALLMKFLIPLLNIVNYDNKGMGWSFRFTLDNVNDREEGVAAVDPDDPREANYAQFDFRFNMADETITVTGGDFGGAYVRADDAVG